MLEEKLTFSISEKDRREKMFELITMEDDIKITPSRFDEDIEKAVTSELNQKLSNKGKGSILGFSNRMFCRNKYSESKLVSIK